MAELGDRLTTPDNEAASEVLSLIESSLHGAWKIADPDASETTRELGHLFDEDIRRLRLFFGHVKAIVQQGLGCDSLAQMLERLQQLFVSRKNEGSWDFASSEDREAVYQLLEAVRTRILKREAEREGSQPCWG